MSQPLDEQLSFLYNVPTLGGEDSDKYKEIVGMYLRDQQLMNPGEAELHLKNRGICETKHAQIKNIVKFDVKGYRADSRELYTLMNFVTVQCEFLALLQNGSQNKSLAGLI